MRWLIVALIVALAGCTDATSPEPEETELPDNFLFKQSGTLEDGTSIVVPFDVDPRVSYLSVIILLKDTVDGARITNDLSASLVQNTTFIASGGNAGLGSSFGNGGPSELLSFERRASPDEPLTDLAGPWELRLFATGVQLADFDIEISVQYI